jgi:hypothetical protein
MLVLVTGGTGYPSEPIANRRLSMRPKMLASATQR